ncbi:MAG: hypothetical protein RRY36_05305 [Bacteroidaceae bacterium]
MLKLKNKNAIFPDKYPKVERRLPTITDPGYTRVGGYELKNKIDFMPQPGMQEFMHTVDADIMFFGGNPGGGKSILISELVLYNDETFREIGQCKVGDEIKNSSGGKQEITGVYPQGMLDIFCITTEIGSVRVSADHLWTFKVNEIRIIGTTIQMLELLKHGNVYLPSYKHKKPNRVISIEDMGYKDECVCIKVSAKNHLFVTSHYILTHNTFGELLFALVGIDKPGYGALIIKKELTSTKDVAGGIIKDAHLIYDGFGESEFTSSDSPSFNFKQWGTTISFTHSNFDANTQHSELKSQERAKNFQCSVIIFDELTGFDYKIWKYWMARNRDSSGIKPKMICTFNTNSHHFSRIMIDWYIGEDGKVREDRIGKVRYAWFKGDSARDIIWGNTREEILSKYNIEVPSDLVAIGMKPADMIKSFVFLPCKMSENRILMNATGGGHATNLFNMGGIETQKLFYENWNAEAGGETTVSRQMIRNMFSNPTDPDVEMFASCDVSGGGDENPMFIWRGDTIIGIEVIKRREGQSAKEWYQELAPWINDTLTRYRVPIRNFSFDATGMGSYLQGYTDGRPVTANLKTIQEVDSFGNPITTEIYYNMRSQLLGKLQFMFETGQISCLLSPSVVLPHGKGQKEFLDILYEEMDVFRRITRNNKFYYKSKDEFKDNYHYSPNYIDAMSYKMIFNLDGKARKAAEPEFSEADYYQAFN